MKDSPIFLTFVFGTLFLVLFSGTFILILLQSKRRQTRHLMEKARLEHQYQQELLQSRLEVQEQAFTNFSQEIHDNVGQVLSLVKMHLFKIGQKTDGALMQDLDRTNELLGKAINDLRNISHTMNNTFVERAGLIDSLQQELDYIASAKGIEYLLEVSGEPYALSPERVLLTFRILQEALGNAMKHGAPSHIHIQCRYLPGSLEINVKDNGKGFDTHQSDKNGIGLNNMLVRARLLAGRLDIRSAPGQGTHLNLHINTSDDPESHHTAGAGR